MGQFHKTLTFTAYIVRVSGRGVATSTFVCKTK